MNGNKQDSTHLICDGEKIIISPDLRKIFDFLMNIEKEIESFINFEKQLKKIKDSYQETLGFTAFLAKKIEENNIDFTYNLSEHPEKIVDKFDFYLPLRSQFIVLFSNLETLFCLYIAYTEENSDEKFIREQTMNSEVTRKFINKFILSDENEYFLLNKKLFGKISAKQIREFRNSLMHFYSVKGGINIIHNDSKNKARKLEQVLKEKGANNTIFISVEDLFSLIRYASKLILMMWSNDYIKNPADFTKRISFVKSIVDNNSAVLVNENNINL